MFNNIKYLFVLFEIKKLSIAHYTNVVTELSIFEK